MPKMIEVFEKIIVGIGSTTSVIVHTILFAFVFVMGALGLVHWDTLLLVLTTAVSLEAIYLAIFIQISVNENTKSLREVESDVDEIQKDIDAIEQDVDEIQEGENEEEHRDVQQQRILENMSRQLQQLALEVEKLKKH